MREHKCMSVLSSLGWGVILQLSQSSVLYSPQSDQKFSCFSSPRIGYIVWVMECGYS